MSGQNSKSSRSPSPASRASLGFLGTRRKKRVIDEARRSIRDPYLVDAFELLDRVYVDLRKATADDQVEEDCYLLCELSRDIAIRLLPFSRSMRFAFISAERKLRSAVDLLSRKPTNANIEKYISNVKRRMEEFAVFIQDTDEK